MKMRLSWTGLFALLFWGFGGADHLAHSADAVAILSDFEKAWTPQKGYMRPADDGGWKARMTAFQRMMSLGDDAVPILTGALKRKEDDTRIFAAQALAFLAAPKSQPALAAALKDASPAVRLYAIDALSLFAPLEAKETLQQLRDRDANRDVRSHAAFALERDDKPQAGAIRKALAEYDVMRIASARLGKPAPDFTLNDTGGKAVKLSQFRGKKTVVLVFIYGDT